MTRRKLVYWLNRSWAVVIFLVALGCGMGGGGSDEQVDVGTPAPPNLNLNLTPDLIDAGDRTNVRALLSDIQLDAFVLKIRYPKTIKYVSNSAFAKVGDRTFDLGPSVEDSDDTNTYLVFFLTRDQFLEQSEGTVNLQLQAITSPGAVLVEGDIDIDDPATSNSTEFDVADPKFDAIDDEPLQVGSGTPAAGGSPTASAG